MGPVRAQGKISQGRAGGAGMGTVKISWERRGIQVRLVRRQGRDGLATAGCAEARRVGLLVRRQGRDALATAAAAEEDGGGGE